MDLASEPFLSLCGTTVVYALIYFNPTQLTLKNSKLLLYNICYKSAPN
ncbi:hypothetical protein E27107_40014 [Elizabethkingia anophelis]|nr:hypothetical protein E18064_350014 [Elizabethkingia anophelis]CDN79062.1 hypothetical protein E27107_40014 [Elizabethkingia anophelis]